MADLNVRDVDEDVKVITEELARRESLSTSAYIRKLLESNADVERRRRAMAAADRRLQNIRAELGIGPVKSGELLKNMRSEYDRTGTST